MKKYLIRTLKTIPLAVFGLSCLGGVLALSTFTVDKMYETKWVWNDDYNPSATPEYGEECYYDLVGSVSCETVWTNWHEYEKGYYFSYSNWGEQAWGQGEHTSFLGNDVPTSPQLFFMLVYGSLFIYAAAKFKLNDGFNAAIEWWCGDEVDN